MGYSLKSISFFSDEITIVPHTVSHYLPIRQMLGRETSIREFCDGQPCSLEQIEETGEYFVRRQDGEFIQGPEC